MGTRTQAQRDAITVEIGYALVTGAFLAAGVFCLVGAPVVVFGLEGGAARKLPAVAAVAACLMFVTRVVRVLWRFTDAARQDRPRVAPAQPSRPGRTGPGS
ncbi:DUF6332 family protein [Streptomyces sp. NPDC006368]|uniref:DUF6332 family protein n=1 Tax=Streptomyces sp. NPDC006368 TaxID=3156760 RepID=UPI0033A7813D